MISSVKTFDITCENKIFRVPVSSFDLNSESKKFYETYANTGYQTSEPIEQINITINAIRGYSSAIRNPLLTKSKLACLLGLTNGIVINIGGSEFVLDRDFLVDNLKYFQSFFSNYQSLHPDYSSVQIDRSPEIFQHIINHLNEKFLSQSILLNYYDDILSDADFYGFANTELPLVYYPAIDLDYFRNPIFKKDNKIYHNYYFRHDPKLHSEIFDIYTEYTDAIFDMYMENKSVHAKLIARTINGNICYISTGNRCKYLDELIRDSVFFRKCGLDLGYHSNDFPLLPYFGESNRKIHHELSSSILRLKPRYIRKDFYGFSAPIPFVSVVIYTKDTEKIVFKKESYDFKHTDGQYYMYFASKISSINDNFLAFSLNMDFDLVIEITFEPDHDSVDLTYVGIDA